ncbi:MAG TPA: SDR family NAD(P)-dependent oxidoreductase [Bryobacteraceae bacterium]|jgi:UDP-glucose 4-epimerase
MPTNGDLAKPKRILITGGAGFIGSHLVDRLALDNSNRLLVIDNLRRGRLTNLEAAFGRFEFIQGDVCDRDLLERTMQGVDMVYHLAAQSNVLGAVMDLDYSFRTNVVGTFEVLRAAANAGVRRLVFTSSREVYGEPSSLPVTETAPIQPKNAYGASKAAAEMYCRTFSSATFVAVILRLANVFGARDFDRVIPIFVERALRGLPLTLYGGKQILDFIWIDMVIDALVRASNDEIPVGPINIGSGQPTDLPTLANRILSESRSSSELLVVPARDVEVSRFVADTTLMKQLLGIQTPEDLLCQLGRLIESAAKHEFVTGDQPTWQPA